jgi:hypothetical protein
VECRSSGIGIFENQDQVRCEYVQFLLKSQGGKMQVHRGGRQQNNFPIFALFRKEKRKDEMGQASSSAEPSASEGDYCERKITALRQKYDTARRGETR